MGHVKLLLAKGWLLKSNHIHAVHCTQIHAIRQSYGRTVHIFSYFIFGESYFEIYNERVLDLLNKRPSSAPKGGLRVREHPVDGPYVESKKAAHSNFKRRLIQFHFNFLR